MKKLQTFVKLLSVSGLVAITMPLFAQSPVAAAPPAASPMPPSKAEITALAKTGPNHQLLAGMTGNWSFAGKHIFPGPAKKPFEFKGTVSKTALWGGRYFMTETTGAKMPMAWADGELIPFCDKTIEGYDNVKNKFVTVSFANELDTGLLLTEGTYNAANQTLTYDGATTSHIHRDIPAGTKITLHDTLKIIDQNHWVFERHESVEGREVIMTQLTYTRM